MKVEVAELGNELDVRCELKRRIREDLTFLIHMTVKMELPSIKIEEDWKDGL